jgi:uncharacterized 2Fe-2S/4Fe-4S cluster protein (DUF4445 family)
LTETVRIVVVPEGTIIQTEIGTILQDAFRNARVCMENVCGGKGECGKCRIVILKGNYSVLPVLSGRSPHPHDEESGVVLSCRTVVQGDLEVMVPVESRISSPRILTARPEVAVDPDPVTRLFPVIRGKADALPFLSPSITLAGYAGPPPGLQDAKSLQMNDFQHGGMAILTEARGYPEIVGVKDCSDGAGMYGAAIDLGTTTVAGVLVDLRNGEVLGGASAMNRQIAFGEEVITRLVHARSRQGLIELQEAAARSISAALKEVAAGAGISPHEIIEATVASNTIMTTLFLGHDPAGLDMPGALVSREILVEKAVTAGIGIHEGAYVSCLPPVSRFIGGDIVGGVLVSGMSSSHDVSLFIDLGTNGEIVIGNDEFLAATSCAAGPAFEGAGLTFGMRARDGAIDHVKTGLQQGVPEVSVIGGGRPVGVCGSGIIDAALFMLRSGIIDFAGKFLPGSPSVRMGSDGYEWVLVPGKDTANGRKIVINQRDLDYLMDSKAATLGAIGVLLKKVRLGVRDIRTLYLAGAFGACTDVSSLVDLGIIPRFPAARVVPLGNSSLSGAYAALVSKEMRRKAVDLAGRMVSIDLLVDPDFIEEYRSALYIPGKAEFFPAD